MFTCIIPTMFKSVKLFNNLIQTIVKDPLVDDLIIVNNTASPFNHLSEKVKVIECNKNVYVNPAWNIGIQEAKNREVFILNDDINIPVNFFEVFTKTNYKDYSAIGVEREGILGDSSTKFTYDTDLEIKEIKVRDWGWGVLFYIDKNHYPIIPDELKVWAGDDFIFQTLKHQNLKIGSMNLTIHTPMSLTSDLPEFDKIKNKDLDFFKTIDFSK